ncbi:MAG: hypothetical protein COY81_04530 [Candidatus Pacebacteria bacterium CG_4_10_14_0_8_um_filter_43_12]|nr:MAG: hypothetical protein COU66_00440 [Candidatus Pacebacteria bacterium CG10_big_fil_rev_8_21_14_0_10_44_11]PIY79151.1 MAG: hypothetical protein COY81_04530 [Candidatus Pacebacteria bacterium CG_4_10_14_0_8_um_filter_43_12]
MARFFCEAVKQVLDHQVIRVGDDDLLLLAEPLKARQEHPEDLKAKTSGEFIFFQSSRSINRRCKIFGPELDRMCLAILREDFPCAVYFIHHGWQVFPTLRSIINFFELLIEQEMAQRIKGNVSFSQAIRQRQKKRGERSGKTLQSVYSDSIQPSL